MPKGLTAALILVIQSWRKSLSFSAAYIGVGRDFIIA